MRTVAGVTHLSDKKYGFFWRDYVKPLLEATPLADFESVRVVSSDWQYERALRECNQRGKVHGGELTLALWGEFEKYDLDTTRSFLFVPRRIYNGKTAVVGMYTF